MTVGLILQFLSFLAGPPPVGDLEEQIRRFTSVYAVVEREAADPVPPEKAIYEGAIVGMLRRLDPHSVFLNKEQFEQLKELQQSKTKGFGSVVSVIPGRVVVLQTLPGTPSEKAGLSPGDEIVAINGVRVATLDMEQLVMLLNQSRQSQARLEVRKPGNSRVFQFVLTPAEMESPSVDRAFLLKPGIGYIRATSFDLQTGAQVRAGIEKLGGARLQGLLLDLRNNPGGALPAALEVASQFLKPGQVLLSVRGRAVGGSEERVPATVVPYTFPLAVLVNGKSASAAEIVAGCLQDHDRAVIVGEPTFGKGLVENVFPLSEGTGLVLTTAFYYTPSGRSIQRPLHEGGQLDTVTGSLEPASSREYRTDSGRKVKGGGGIEPDIVVFPPALSRLQLALEASGSFTSFATQYIREHGPISEDFEVPPAALDEFQAYLAERRIAPALGEWSNVREWVRNRLRTEIFNQAFGVEKGDEVELRRDPQVLAALQAIQ